MTLLAIYYVLCTMYYACGTEEGASELKLGLLGVGDGSSSLAIKWRRATFEVSFEDDFDGGVVGGFLHVSFDFLLPLAQAFLSVSCPN